MSPRRRRRGYVGEDPYSAKPCLTVATGGPVPVVRMDQTGRVVSGEGAREQLTAEFIAKGAKQKRRQEDPDYEGFGWQPCEPLTEEQINALEGFYTEEERAELYAYGRALSLSELHLIPGSPAWEQIPEPLAGRVVPAHISVSCRVPARDAQRTEGVSC